MASWRQFKVCYKENKTTNKFDSFYYRITVPRRKMAERFKSALNLIFLILKHPGFPRGFRLTVKF